MSNCVCEKKIVHNFCRLLPKNYIRSRLDATWARLKANVENWQKEQTNHLPIREKAYNEATTRFFFFFSFNLSRQNNGKIVKKAWLPGKPCRRYIDDESNHVARSFFFFEALMLSVVCALSLGWSLKHCLAHNTNRTRETQHPRKKLEDDIGHVTGRRAFNTVHNTHTHNKHECQRITHCNVFWETPFWLGLIGPALWAVESSSHGSRHLLTELPASKKEET